MTEASQSCAGGKKSKDRLNVRSSLMLVAEKKSLLSLVNLLIQDVSEVSKTDCYCYVSISANQKPG